MHVHAGQALLLSVLPSHLNHGENKQTYIFLTIPADRSTAMTDVHSTSFFFWPAAGAVAWLLYLGFLAIYRLYLSPIARFPGPRLAALSLWYEFYHDVVRGGQYCFKINELHDQYGMPFYFTTADKGLRLVCRTYYPDQSLRTSRSRSGILRCTLQWSRPKARQMVVVGENVR